MTKTPTPVLIALALPFEAGALFVFCRFILGPPKIIYGWFPANVILQALSDLNPFAAVAMSIPLWAIAALLWRRALSRF